jgi:RND family efflux transporter MFP subunit
MRTTPYLLPLTLVLSWNAASQEMPPASVGASVVRSGTLSPTQEFKGTVYFKEVSEVASEVTGKVVDVLFEEGQHLEEGAPMVRLDDALLRADLKRQHAEVEAARARLEQEKARYERNKELVDRGVTTPQEYDDIRYTVSELESRLIAAEGQVARTEEEIRKKTILAPFNGQVLLRQSEKGDWKEEGDSIAQFARDGLYDVIVQIPEKHLQYLRRGMPMRMEVLGRQVEGKIAEGSPQGDPATRTFPIKIRVEGHGNLLQGMSAVIPIPVDATAECLIVPRDSAILDGQGGVVFTVENGTARRHEVEILGPDGASDLGVLSETLKPGMTIVTKGHERLREGQAVQIIGE